MSIHLKKRKKYYCVKCPEVLRSKNRFLRHMERIHFNNIPYPPEIVSHTVSYQSKVRILKVRTECILCGKEIYSSDENIRLHVLLHLRNEYRVKPISKINRLIIAYNYIRTSIKNLTNVRILIILYMYIEQKRIKQRRREQKQMAAKLLHF